MVSKTRHKQLILGFVLFCTAWVMHGASVSAINAEFQQTILPRPCDVITNVAVDGTVSYTLPPGCGIVVSPPTAPIIPPTTNFSAISGGGQPNASPFSPVSRLASQPPAPPAQSLPLQNVDLLIPPIFLPSGAHEQPIGGYVLLANTTQRFTFRLSNDSSQSPLRSLQVVAVSGDVLTIRLTPGGQQIQIKAGKKVPIDFAYDSMPDMVLTFQRVMPDGKVVLRAYFPAQPLIDDAVGETKYAFYANMVILTAVTIAFYELYHGWYLLKHKLPSKNWWVVHEHDPFSDHAPKLRTKHRKKTLKHS